MQDFAQIWFWIAIAAIVGLFLLRRGSRAHHGTGHGGRFKSDGYSHNHSEDRRGGDHESAASAPEAVIDPVSGAAIPTAGAISTIYQGKAYYFASKENRDRFETAPQDYADKAQGVALRGPDEAETHHHRRRRGC